MITADSPHYRKDMPVPQEHPPIAEAQTEPGVTGCPVASGRLKYPTEGGGNRDWWPNQLNLKILQKNPLSRIPWARVSTTPRNSRPSI